MTQNLLDENEMGKIKREEGKQRMEEKIGLAHNF